LSLELVGSDIVIQKLDRKTKDKAYLLYLGGQEINQIAFVLKVEPTTLRFFIFGEDGTGSSPVCWFNTKKKLGPTVVSLYLADKLSVLEKVAGLGLSIINKALGDLNDAVHAGTTVLSVDEISKLAGVVVGMDKIVRLESNQATELIEHIGLTRAEAREILINDPFNTVDVVATSSQTTELPWLDNE